jgi:16S rRNA (guanine527-N7)-methyltransferase
MLSEPQVVQLLSPFGLALTSAQAGCLLTYLDLLLRWNQKINLTAIRTPEECVTRHFGESLYLARWIKLEGRLLDIGSGAGFPGLALKIAFPALAVTLLEPVAKKRAFLKEVARACQMESVEVRSERLEDFIRRESAVVFDSVTVRAVGELGRLIPGAGMLLKAGGRLCLWMSEEQVASLIGTEERFHWEPAIPLPLSHRREIRVGIRTGSQPT